MYIEHILIGCLNECKKKKNISTYMKTVINSEIVIYLCVKQQINKTSIKEREITTRR